jgi:hypothetical protein
MLKIFLKRNIESFPLKYVCHTTVNDVYRDKNPTQLCAILPIYKFYEKSRNREII